LFSCFACTNSFLAVTRVSGLVFMFGVPGLVFDGTEGNWSHFHVLPARTPFRRYRGRPILFSCFPLLEMFSAISRESGPVFMFCAPGVVFGGIVGVGSRFRVLRFQTCFRRYRGRRVPFSCFTLPDSFSALIEGVPSRFHVFLSRICVRRY
jgi:hypothetical protein